MITFFFFFLLLPVFYFIWFGFECFECAGGNLGGIVVVRVSRHSRCVRKVKQEVCLLTGCYVSREGGMASDGIHGDGWLCMGYIWDHGESWIGVA